MGQVDRGLVVMSPAGPQFDQCWSKQHDHVVSISQHQLAWATSPKKQTTCTSKQSHASPISSSRECIGCVVVSWCRDALFFPIYFLRVLPVPVRASVSDSIDCSFAPHFLVSFGSSSDEVLSIACEWIMRVLYHECRHCPSRAGNRPLTSVVLLSLSELYQYRVPH